jgi:threonylcarbamoyladenosine tRNA methylthiotransferase MtaB
LNKIETIRKIRPDMSITTDLIVGFPGETEEDFSETIETIKKVSFSKIHVFPFSVRKGTVAEKMDNQIPENIKKERVKKIIELSKELEIKYMEKFIGKEVLFIPETKREDYIIGHTGNYLLIKSKSSIELNHEAIKCKLDSVNYPYIIATIFDSE